MKKTYLKPTTDIVKVQMTHMIAVSVVMYGSNANDAAMSRDGYDWDDED